LLFRFLLLYLKHFHISLLTDFMRRLCMQYSSLTEYQLRLIEGAILASLAWLSKQPGLFKDISEVYKSFVGQYLVHVIYATVEVHFCVKLLHLSQSLSVTFSHIVFISPSICFTEFSLYHILKRVWNLAFLSCYFSNETSSIKWDCINRSELKSWLEALGNKGQKVEL
jgi:hypothetical protein